MDVLVTGAAGFIGSTLVDRLLGDGAHVLGVDDFCDFYDPARKRGNLAAARDNSRFELVGCDVRDAAGLARATAGRRFDAVIHLAAMAGVRPSLQRPFEYGAVNVEGTANVLEVAQRTGARRFVFASSSSVYGRATAYPFPEDLRLPEPISPYAATKIEGERLCRSFHERHGVSISCLRLFTVFGPRQRPDLAISRFLEQVSRGEPITVFGDGSTSRDYTYVDDIVAGIVAALQRDDPFAVHNLGNCRGVTLTDLVRLVERVVGREARIDRRPLQEGEMTHTLADVSRAREELGYQPCTSLEEGVARQWDWMQARAARG